MFGYDKDDIEILSPSLVQMIKTFRRKDLMVSCTQFKAPANILKKLRIFARRLEEVIKRVTKHIDNAWQSKSIHFSLKRTLKPLVNATKIFFT